MKRCPLCGRTFPDEYSFCLTDGTPLQTFTAAEAPAILGVAPLTEEATVVKERPTVRRSRARGIIIFVLAALLSLSLGITAAVLYFFWPRLSSNQPPQIATASPTPTASAAASPTPTLTATPTPTASPISTPSPQRTDEPAPPPEPSDPGTTRITFRAGRVHETVSGRVSDQRSFILSARPGQTLSAEIDSEEGCVKFAIGDSAVQYRTRAGDNSLTILNSCDGPARFTLSVSIR
jgi:hypothetical protein